MNWLEFIIETDAGHREEVEAALEECAAQAITLNDAGDEPILEPLPFETPMWSHVRITALFDNEVDCFQVEQQVRDKFPGLFTQWRALKDQQWERVWLERFKPTQFGQRLWIIPSESAPVDESAVNIFMDPGLAFGTGDHPTTDLCLQWLDDTNLVNQRVLDYGHGSGVLAIAAHKLGARDVIGVDIDPQAIIAGLGNAKRNQIERGILFTQTAPSGCFDVVIANILAAPLITMAEKLSTYLSKGGKIALSGILESQASEVQQAFSPWIAWQEQRTKNNWVCISGIRASNNKSP